jgi:DNA helicase HerA-like ATPase
MNEEADSSAFAASLRAARRRFKDRYRALPLANSVDGRTFSFRGPLSLFLNPGAYVGITTDKGDVLLGQVLEREIEDIEGPEVRLVDADSGLDEHGVTVSEASIRLQSSVIRGTGVILGSVSPEHQGSELTGFVEAEISLAATDDLGAMQKHWARNRPTLEIGHIRGTDKALPVLIDARGFTRHTFLCGQSGSGKTYSLGVVLEQLLLNTDLRIAILDPNADYVKLNALRPSPAGRVLTSDETSTISRYEERVASLKVIRSESGDSPNQHALRVRFSNLSNDDQARVLQLDALRDREEFDVTRKLAAGIGRGSYQIEDIQQAGSTDLSHAARQVLLRISNLGVADWAVWARDSDTSLAEILAGDWRSVVLDVSRFERPIERSVVALATLRHFWEHRESRVPVLIVIDEAHNVCPKEPLDEVQAAATELAISIAGEGRKYGIYLLVSTQRPDKLHPNVLSQCDNLILMRMNSRTDLGDLEQIFSFVPPGILAEALSFRLGEALVAGKLVPAPMLMSMGHRLSAEGGADVPADWAIIS